MNKKLLVAYGANSQFTATTADFVRSFGLFSKFDVEYFHVTNISGYETIPLDAFDAILLSYCARLWIDDYVSSDFLAKLTLFSGVKGIFIQDEYDFVEKERQMLDKIKPELIFTCVSPQDREKVYPSARYPKTKFVQVLTGYLNHYDREELKQSIPLAKREILLGYRGRSIAERYGVLGKQKKEIGEVFAKEAVKRGINFDIASDEKSRLYGAKWTKWLGQCRCVLGTESGSNIFDFDGSIAEEIEASKVECRPVRTDILEKMKQLDQEFSMGQISPRIFEAANAGTAMILYRGSYSGILTPDLNYIPVELDHSNMESVFTALNDLDRLTEMVKRTEDDLIRSDKFLYKTFVAFVDKHLETAICSENRKQLAGRGVAEKASAHKDPRSRFRCTTREPITYSFWLIFDLLKNVPWINSLPLDHKIFNSVRFSESKGGFFLFLLRLVSFLNSWFWRQKRRFFGRNV